MFLKTLEFKENLINPIGLQDAGYEKNHIVDTAVSVPVSVEVISSIEVFFTLRDKWNAINDQSAKGNVFVSWEWLYTWWETYHADGNRQLYILTYKNEQDKIVGIAPFQIINNPKKYFPCGRQLILLGTGETDGSMVFGEYMDLIIEAGYETAAINSFSNYLIKHKSLWDGLKFHELLDGSHLSRLFLVQDNVVVKTLSEHGFRTIIDLPKTYKEYLMSLRKKMRNNITRSFSRLEKEQEYKITTVTEESEIDEAITVIAELNRSRRGNMEKDSVFEQLNFECFHRSVVKRLLPLDKISLRVLSFDDKPVAALYSFLDGETIHPYQSGFETINGHRYSLLTTMLTQEIEKSIDNPKLKRFNFMYSDEESTYKRRYTGITEAMYKLSFDKPSFKYTIYRFIHGPIKSLVKKLFRIGND